MIMMELKNNNVEKERKKIFFGMKRVSVKILSSFTMCFNK